jgi:kynurenine formamidase
MAKLSHWPYDTYNRGRWPNDHGTLNLLGPKTVERAVKSIKSYENISIGRDLVGEGNAPGRIVYEHEMTSFGSYSFQANGEQLQNAADRVTIDVHGMVNTHLDALSHVGHLGVSYNDVPFNENATKEGVKRFSIIDMATIVTRAWLIDVPRQRGIVGLEPGSPVLPADLMRVAGKVLPGDALVVRTGRYSVAGVSADDPRARDNHGDWSGLHVDCLELIHKWDVALTATDGPGDNFPSTTKECSVPIHVISEGYMGMPLTHSLNLEALAEKMAKRDDKSFLLSIAPLRIRNGTGSPVNPTAII